MVEELQEETLETPETSELEQTEEVVEEVVEENPELKKAQELAKNYRIRAEKAETLAKQLKKPEEKEAPKTSEKPEYSLQDIRALQDVHDDDVDEVVEFAKFKGISITEAKKSLTVQNLLNAKKEERKTAEATNVGGSRKGSSKSTAEEIHEKAMSGQVPESDEDMKKMIEHRFTPKELK